MGAAAPAAKRGAAGRLAFTTGPIACIGAIAAGRDVTAQGTAGRSIGRMTMAETDEQATGTFEVTLTPIAGGGGPIAGMTIAKTFRGDLEAISEGQMLAFRSAVAGSAGYVAMERVTGRLAGREGGFTLQHGGIMDRGEPALSVVVVPDSGTDGLAGLTGTMDIVVEDGRHDYCFRYTLPAATGG